MIDIRNISFAYDKSGEVFHDFSMRIGENRICGLLGKNGTGKSTLLYLICGLLRPTRGDILVDGTPVGKRLPAMLSEMYIVPEEFDLPPISLDLYVKTNQVFYPRFSQETLERCLTDFELPLQLQLDRLSMGEKKKVLMSFALATNTKMLFMDEPTNGLDIPSKSQFRRTIAGNMSEERTLIISTHQVHDIEQLLDHILILDRSRVWLDATVADICSRYTFGYRLPGEMTDDVIYAEPTLQGNAVIAPRSEDEPETQLNLELLFTAAVKGLL